MFEHLISSFNEGLSVSNFPLSIFVISPFFYLLFNFYHFQIRITTKLYRFDNQFYYSSTELTLNEQRKCFHFVEMIKVVNQVPTRHMRTDRYGTGDRLNKTNILVFRVKSNTLDE